MVMLKQPALGIVATAVTIVVSLAVIAPWPFVVFNGDLADAMMCGIPFSMVVGAFWHGHHPGPVARLRQPWRGLAYLVLTTAAAAVVFVVQSVTVGGGRGATPFRTFPLILSIVITLWFCVVWGGWPFSLIKNRVLGGTVLLVVAYVAADLVARCLDYSFLAHAPFYAGMDPHGPIAAWDGLVVAVTSLAVMYVFVHLELWPLHLIKGVMRQPILGLVWSVAAGAIAWALYLAGTRGLGMTPDAFMVGTAVPYIFGSVILISMLGGSATARLRTRSRGVVAAVLAAVVGIVLAGGYRLVMPMITEDVPAPTPVTGPLEQNLWLASALLAVTFPLMALCHDYFRFWPLGAQPRDGVPESEVVAAPAG